MPRNLRESKTPILVCALALMALLLLPACSVNVKKDERGQDKNVDIQTPVGGIHVSKDADARDVGLPVYPGARPKEQKGNDGSSANVNMNWGPFGLKVIALGFVTDDAPDKVAAFYRDKLKSFGNVLECHTDKGDPGDLDVNFGDKPDKGSQELKCGPNNGKNLELKVGTKDNQHLVSIRPQESGAGTYFALVYVRAHGDKDKDTI